MKVTLKLLFIVSVLFKIEMCLITSDNDNNNVILATYYGGCGHSQMVKRNIVRNLVKELNENQKMRNANVAYTADIMNLALEKNMIKYKELNENVKRISGKSINEYKENNLEFNIYVLKNNVKYLVYTSDKKNKDVYVKQMMSEKEIVSTVVQRVNDLVTIE
jgi:hypothetical protein